MNKNALVLVTGASGFVGIHCVKALLEAGYKVRGTVRSLKNEFKVKPIYDLSEGKADKIELVEADLMKEEGWESAVNGCDYVFHVASPVPLDQPKDRDEIIKPAVEGTMNVLKACAKVHSVKRVVYTSSVAAIISLKDDIDGNKTFTEADWLDPSLPNTAAYNESKMRAETSAWQFVDSLKGKKDQNAFELVTICPGFILGPMIHDVHCTSAEVIRKLMMHEIPLIPRMYMGTIDVRDVAKAHLQAITVPDAAGKRFICIHGQGWMDELAQTVSDEFSPQGYRVATWRCPYFLVWISSFFSESAKLILPYVDKPRPMDNSRIKDVLGMDDMISTKDAVLSMAYSLVERGIVPKTDKFQNKQEK